MAPRRLGRRGVDWRGQGGSRGADADDAAPADDRTSFDPLIDDLAAFVADWQARTPAPHVIVAHSMGAHVALRACAERGVTPDALVLVAPMLALNTRRLPTWLARLAIAGAVRGGRGAARRGRMTSTIPRVSFASPPAASAMRIRSGGSASGPASASARRAGTGSPPR